MVQINLSRVKLSPLIMAVILLAFTASVLAFKFYQTDNPKQTTRILTWWGIFDSQKKIKELEALCDTQLEIVEYRYIEGMMNLTASYSYDLYIYPWGYHKRIEPYFQQAGPRINWVVDDYHSAIKQKYDAYDVPPDTVFFQHALQMYVYDKSYIPELERLTAEDIMALAHSNAGKVFMMDISTQMDRFIKQLKTGTPEENWRRLYQDFRKRRAWNQANQSGFHFYNFASSYLDERLILGGLTSGEVMNPHHDWRQIKDPSGQPKDLGFGVHPTLSQITADMLALKSHDSRDQCVAHALSGRDFLKWAAETTFYFSPFEERIDSHPETLQRLTQEFYDNADKLSWLYDGETELLSPEAEVIWNIMIACQYDAKRCDQWTSLGDKVFAGST